MKHQPERYDGAGDPHPEVRDVPVAVGQVEALVRDRVQGRVRDPAADRRRTARPDPSAAIGSTCTPSSRRSTRHRAARRSRRTC